MADDDAPPPAEPSAPPGTKATPKLPELRLGTTFTACSLYMGLQIFGSAGAGLMSGIAASWGQVSRNEMMAAAATHQRLKHAAIGPAIAVHLAYNLVLIGTVLLSDATGQ